MSRRSSIARTLLVIFFVALLATPLVIKWLSRRTDAPAADRQAALSRYGFSLEEVAKTSGIDFTHQAPRLDSKLDHIMPQVASMGAAVSVVDFDRDGWQDLYVTNSGEGSEELPLPQPRRRHVQGRGRRAGRRGREPAGHGRLHGRGLGRLRQRRLRRPVPLQVGTPRAVPQRRGPRLHARDRSGGASRLGQRQHGHLVRLRPRRAARPFPRRLLPRDRSTSGT